MTHLVYVLVKDILIQLHCEQVLKAITKHKAIFL